MKRSEVNHILKASQDFFNEYKFKLPMWGYWKPEDWITLRQSEQKIKEFQLGWDITDFGSGDFKRRGLTLFTVRNGSMDVNGANYAEKIMIVNREQETPLHFHREKTEDIINRGGGELKLQFWNSDFQDKLADTKVEIYTDGILKVLQAGDYLTLIPGESVRITTGLYHRFFGAKAPVLVGEVSKVNDDKTDNHFLESIPRFPALVEDELPWRLLVTDYEKYLG